jgi:ABC-2 type transport system ATP-binding protein
MVRAPRRIGTMPAEVPSTMASTAPATPSSAALAAPAVATDGLTKRFGDVAAVEGLGLTVARNSILGFLGPNGAGKTTTMKMLLGLLRPTEGGATVFGLDITRDSEEIRSRIGYLPQLPRFYDHLTARETLRFAARFYYAGPPAAIEERVDAMLELTGLADKADRPVKGFSGGELQRLGIAQAQVNEPELLILDEPAASLDPLGRRDVLNILERLRATSTVIYSTHILDDVQRVSDTVAILNRGRLVAEGPIDQLLAGGSGMAYLLTVRGDGESAAAALTGVPWVSDVSVTAEGATSTLVVGVTDVDAAERDLLRLVLADRGAVVADFRRRAAGLEEVFIGLVEEGAA